ncbi:MAG: argininosuccinate lyase, partial [Gaiellaceae bacterium]
MTLWAARTGVALDPDVDEFLRADDAELLPYDCAATAVHAQRLHAVGILDDVELADVETRLATIADEGAAYLSEYEDVHSAIEGLLGPVGRKIHAGRSRNDQVAAAARLYVQDASAEATTSIARLVETILDVAEREAETPLPGYTHLQRAQPVTFGHHLHAWVEMLERDRTRFDAAAASAEPSPLGAGALAGSTLPLPLPTPSMRNSLDAVADRDFALDYLYAAAVLFTHLSRIGEEIVLWCTSEFGFVTLPPSASTGSSMMPQKLNPDVAELARGKAGTAIGRLTGLLAVVKGLPLAYDKDLQEDKTPLFQTRRDVRGALAALGVLIDGLELNHERLAAAVSDPLLRATDAAEALVRDGMAFRDAHEVVAAAVRGGTFVAPERLAPRAAPGPAGVNSALHDARLRIAARSLADTTRALVGRDLTTLTTWSAYELRLVLDLAEQMKAAQKNGIEHRLLPGKTLGLLFARPSTRTRVSFAVAMEQLGGSAITLNTSELQLSRGEPLEDTARILAGYLDA